MIDFSKLFIDTTPLIYYVEKNPEYYDVLKKFLWKVIMQKRMHDRFDINADINGRII